MIDKPQRLVFDRDLCLVRGTVKLVYRDYSRDQKCGPFYTQVVSICRFNTMESIHLGTCKCGLYKQVVFISRQSLEQV